MKIFLVASATTAISVGSLIGYPLQAMEKNFDVGVGYRTDNLHWNIASDITGTATPNIISELTWSNLKIVDFHLGGNYTDNNGFHIRGTFNYGFIFDGKNQDSDYLTDNRTNEFSRSNNDSDDGNTMDFSLAFGKKIQYQLQGIPTYVIPLLGLSRHEQNLRMTNGFQTIPALGPFPGLNSTYDTEWSGPWIGMEMGTQRDTTTGFLRVELHQADFSAKANWNLRPDFAHPVSFTHDADGTGRVISIGFYSNKNKDWNYRFNADYNAWETDPGVITFYPAIGSPGIQRLNEVVWRSFSLNFSMVRAFQ